MAATLSWLDRRFKRGVCLVDVGPGWFKYISRVLGTFQVGPGLRLTRSPTGFRWRLDLVGASRFNGEVIVAGATIAAEGTLNTDSAKPYVKVVLGAPPVASEEVGPPSDPWPDSEVWRKKAHINGTLYIDRVG